MEWRYRLIQLFFTGVDFEDLRGGVTCQSLLKLVSEPELHRCPLASQSRASFTTWHCHKALKGLLIPFPAHHKYRACCVLFHIFNNNASQLALPRISQRGEEEQYTSAGFPLKWRLCNISRHAIVGQQYVSQRQGKFPTLCAYQTPGWWALVSPLLLGSLFLFPLSLLCHLFMTRARCHAILSQFWISLLLAILLGCPIHE